MQASSYGHHRSEDGHLVDDDIESGGISLGSSVTLVVFKLSQESAAIVGASCHEGIVVLFGEVAQASEMPLIAASKDVPDARLHINVKPHARHGFANGDKVSQG